MRVELPEPLVAKLSPNPDLYSLVLGSVDRFGTAFNYSGTPFFRAYTDHGPKHVSEVIETCVGLITPRAWRVFTASDATVLVLATLLHDAALHLQEDGFIQLISGNHSWNGIAGIDTASWQELWDSYRAEASRFDRRKLRELFGTEEPVDPPDAKEPHRWTTLQFEFVGEFVRRHHPRLAHEIAVFGMPGPNGKSLRLLDADAAILDLAGLTARSHGIPLRACLPHLEAKYHRQEFQEIHAVFLMGVLRIADYLQIQADRAPKEILQIKALRSPLSRREWNVHHAIRNITYNDPDPEAIRIQLDASKTDLETFLRLREWLGGIQAEIDTTWAVFGEVYGRYGEQGLDQLSLIVRRIRSDLDDMNAFSRAVDYVPELLRFTASDAELLQLLLQPLYGNHPTVGIREMLQNAVDAVAERRVYVEQHIKSLAEGEPNSDAPAVIIEVDETARTVRVSDRGIGMTATTVRDYFLKAGATFRRSDLWRAEFLDSSGASKVLRSGRFGVGALAAFLLGDRIEVTTRHANASSGVTFSTTLLAERIELKRTDCPVGTNVAVYVTSRMIDLLRKGDWDWFCLDQPVVTRSWINDGSTTAAAATP